MKLLVSIILGHKSTLRDSPSSTGHSHDWELYVDSDGEIGQFIDKVCFKLHDSYDNPKRTVVIPPFRIRDAGYAGFIAEITVYFKNNEEPKSATFSYDLFLQSHGGPINPTRIENLIFNSPGKEFADRLKKGGAIILGNPMDDSQSQTSTTDPMDGDGSQASYASNGTAKKRKLEPAEQYTGDEFDTFGQLIAHKLRAISRINRVKAIKTEAKIQQLVFETEVAILEKR